jgi:ubiquitin-protein ligase
MIIGAKFCGKKREHRNQFKARMSRATLLLQKELWKIENSVVAFGININLVRNSMYHWRVSLSGLLDTPYAGGTFTVNIHLFTQV